MRNTTGQHEESPCDQNHKAEAQREAGEGGPCHAVRHARIEVSDDEMQMALTLIEMLEQPFDPEQYHDEYRDALTTVIDAKLAGEEVAVAEQPETAKVIDRMAALKASVEATRAKAG